MKWHIFLSVWMWTRAVCSEGQGRRSAVKSAAYCNARKEQRRPPLSDSPPDLPITDMWSGYVHNCSALLGLDLLLQIALDVREKKLEGQCLLQASDWSLPLGAFIINPKLSLLNTSSSLPLLHVAQSGWAWKIQSEDVPSPGRRQINVLWPSSRYFLIRV